MAGGIGTRFWPKSRQAMPKQFLDILGTGKSFIRHTYERFAPLIPISNFIVVTNARYKELVMEHIPEIDESQVLCEPIGRNTAPCICYAVYSLLKKGPHAEMVITPADNFILNEELFREVVSECFDFIKSNNVLMTVGVKPTRPETGYGYIQVSDKKNISKVKSFTEKPNIDLATTFVDCGEFMWNAGIFIWKLEDIIQALKKYLPELNSLFSSIINNLGTESESEAINRVFSECKSISIDYGVIEKADNVYVRSCSVGWSDVGTWSSVLQLSERDENMNSSSPNNFLYATHNSYVSVEEGKIAVVSGLDNYIVVDTDDVLMICPRREEQEIKRFIEEVKYHQGDKHI